MNHPRTVPPTATRRALLILTLSLAVGLSAAWSDPGNRYDPSGLAKLEHPDSPGDVPTRRIYDGADTPRQRRRALDARTGLVLPRGYSRPTYSRPIRAARAVPAYQTQTAIRAASRSETFVAPRFQEHPQPQYAFPEKPVIVKAHSRLTLPVPLPSAPASDAEQNVPDSQSAQNAQDPPDREEPSPVAEREKAAPRAVPDGPEPVGGGEDEKITTSAPEVSSIRPRAPYGTPVRGCPGYVYPPGAEGDESYMIDARNFVPGQKARDPRPGDIFVVPPRR